VQSGYLRLQAAGDDFVHFAFAGADFAS